MTASGAIDWAHTDQAEHNRTAKARALAAASRRLGFGPDDLVVGSVHRKGVRLTAGLPSVSEETWHAACVILAASVPKPVCSWTHRDDHAGAVHLYLGGLLCDAHAPWALAGRARPVPPADSTLAALRSRRAIAAGAHQGPRSTVVDQRAIASGKRRSTNQLYQAARAEQAAHRRGRRSRS